MWVICGKTSKKHADAQIKPETDESKKQILKSKNILREFYIENYLHRAHWNENKMKPPFI